MTPVKGIEADRFHTIANIDGGKGGAILKGVVRYFLYTIGDFDRGKRGAIDEGIIFDRCYAIAKINGGKGGTSAEGSPSDGGDAIWDSDRSKLFSPKGLPINRDYRTVIRNCRGMGADYQSSIS